MLTKEEQMGLVDVADQVHGVNQERVLESLLKVVVVVVVLTHAGGLSIALDANP